MRRSFASRMLALLAIWLLLIGLASLSLAAEPQARTVRVGWFPYSGYQETSATGEHSGYNYDYLMRIAQETGWKYEFVEANWDECLQMIQAGEIDLLGSILWSREREEIFAFPEFDCGIVYTSLCVAQSSTLSGNDFSHFNGLRISGVEQTRCWQDLGEFAKKQKFTYFEEPRSTLEEAMQAVRNGEAEAIIFGGFPQQEGLRTVARFAPSSFYFVTGRQNQQILDELNQALSGIGLSDPYFDSNLAAKYNPPKAEALEFTPVELQYLSSAPTLRVLCSGNWLPLEGFDAKSGSFYGMVPGIFEEISNKTGLLFEFVRTDEPAVVADTLAKGEAQLVASFEGSHEEASKLGMNLSEPYFSLPMMVISDPNAALAVANITAAVQQSFLYDAALLDHYRLQLYPTDDQCISALMRGEVGQVVLNGYTANLTLSQGKFSRWQVSPLQGLDLDLRIGVQKNLDPVLLSILNKSIAQIGEAQTNRIILSNTIRSEENPLIAAVNRLPVYVVLIFSGLLLIVILVLARVLVNRSRGERTINALLYYDSLTGLLNQRGFEKEVRRILRSAPKSDCYVISHLDINSFEVYNSLYGFEAGDRLLCTIARIISEESKTDQPSARLSGDNFVKLALVRDMAEMIERTSAVNQRINEVIGGQNILISYGLYEITDRSLSVSAMLDMASAAKRTVKGNYERFIGVYDEEMRRRQLDETKLVSWMEQALTGGEFVPYYQPKYNITTRKIAGAEALVRWIRPDGEIISPARFVALFEKNGLIARIDRHIFRQVCRQLVALRQLGIDPVPISVNFSRVHLYDETLAASLLAICEEYGVEPRWLEIELTESAFVVRSEILSRAIEDLHRVGFSVSMDDFGSGFSSLNMLKDMYFDIVKLDGGFLVETSETARGQKVIESILFLTRRLRLKTVAEGVETVEQLALLQAHGCDLAQGYYFSRPVPASDFVRMLKEQPNSPAEPDLPSQMEREKAQGEEIGILEMRDALGAMLSIYSMVISANITQNTYCLLECDRFSTRRVRSVGVLDDLVEIGALDVRPEDRQTYFDLLSRKALLEAHARGEKQLRRVLRQIGPRGGVVPCEVWVMFVEDPSQQNVVGLLLFHTLEEDSTEPIPERQ